MPTTTQLRNWWAPACTGPFSLVELFGDGRVSVRPAIVPAVRALDACLQKHNYRTRRADTGAYNCRRITGGTGYSLHAYGIALDINWQSNPYGPRLVTNMPAAMIRDIKAIRTRNGQQVWRWGGDYSGNKDAMHFEIVCHPTDLATGIDTGNSDTLEPDEGDFLMALTDAEQREVLAAIRKPPPTLRCAACGLDGHEHRVPGREPQPSSDPDAGPSGPV